jgi:hypothetical protein
MTPEKGTQVMRATNLGAIGLIVALVVYLLMR